MKFNNKIKKTQINNLHKRFIKWVLLPPFIALILLSLLGLWSLNKLLKQQAITDLQRSADTTATVLEREISLRREVLKRTATEMLVIQNQFTDLQKQLLNNRDECNEFILSERDYVNSPNGVCDQFASDFANNGLSLAVLEDSYLKIAQQQVETQTQRTNERLGAFKQIFPETLALVIVDENNKVQSSALSGVLEGSTKPFLAYTEQAIDSPVDGEQLKLEGFNLGVFAYPVNGGAALAAYDTYNSNFLKIVWDSAPIDRTQALAVIVDAEDNVAYPNINAGYNIDEFENAQNDNNSSELDLDGVKHTLVNSTDSESGWGVIVASPTAAVLAQSRDAQLLSVIIICLFIIGFIWVGSLFIQRTLANIVRLMSGALIFSSGRLDYEIQLDNADSEFIRLGETMNKMAQRIADAEEALDQKNKEFINVATHEIRAPLTSVIGYLDLLDEMHSEKLDDQAQKLLHQSMDSSVKLKNLVNDMLDVARLESGRSTFNLESIDINDVIEESIKTMQVVADEKNIALNYNADKSGVVLADEAKLRIVVTNFISNAIKYNNNGGEVNVFHQLNNGQLTTAVKDNGLGIPDSQKQHMFEKFFRVDDVDRKSVIGTGLGMYITKQYIEEMNGKLWFESEHGTGTTFYFSLPVAHENNKTKRNKVRSHAKKAVKALRRTKQ